MAWTLVGQITFNIPDGTTDQDVTLPGTPAEGDIVIYAHASDNTCSPGVTTAGYTDLLTDHGADNPGRESGYKVLGSTPDTVITFDNDGAEVTAGVLQVWRGCDPTTPADVTPTTATGGSGAPDAPSITPVTNGCLIVVIGFLDDDNSAASVTAPSGYSNLLAHDNSANADNATAMIASKELATAAAENPAAFGGGLDDEWAAVTFAVRPDSGGGGGTVIPVLMHSYRRRRT